MCNGGGDSSSDLSASDIDDIMDSVLGKKSTQQTSQKSQGINHRVIN